jgi:hypothetical protein
MTAARPLADPRGAQAPMKGVAVRQEYALAFDRRMAGQSVLVGEQLVSEGDLAYLGGLFDGEGCVSIRKRGDRWEAELRIVNTCLPVLMWVVSLTGGPICRRPKFGAGKDSFEVRLAHRRAERWGAALVPYLRIKQDEVALLLEFRKTITRNSRQPLSAEVEGYRRQIVSCCRALKRRRWSA